MSKGTLESAVYYYKYARDYARRADDDAEQAVLNVTEELGNLIIAIAEHLMEDDS